MEGKLYTCTINAIEMKHRALPGTFICTWPAVQPMQIEGQRPFVSVPGRAMSADGAPQTPWNEELYESSTSRSKPPGCRVGSAAAPSASTWRMWFEAKLAQALAAV